MRLAVTSQQNIQLGPWLHVLVHSQLGGGDIGDCACGALGDSDHAERGGQEGEEEEGEAHGGLSELV